MKSNIIHSFVVCLAAFTLLFVAACSSQEESLPDNVAEAVLYLNVEQIGQTRAGELPDNEKMHSLRVVLLHEDGTVEHNRHFSLQGAQVSKYVLLKVKTDEKKQIFLFANEESVTAVEGVTGGSQTLTRFFESYAADASGFADAVNGLYFAPDYTGGKPIPMSSVYEIQMPKAENFEGTFHVVRVATKFSVNFKSWRTRAVTVESFSIASHADRNYLMAHVGDSEQNTALFKGKSWIDWLKEVSDASSVNDSYEVTEAAGWLKDYSLPTQENAQNTYTHQQLVVPKATLDRETPDNSQPGEASAAVFYLPESKNLKAGATDGEQEYTMTISIDDVDEQGQPLKFEFPLPNLKALFRNTHVVVNITMDESPYDFEVEVIPFTAVTLKPNYGLEREEYTGYVVGGKDEVEGESYQYWYDANYYEPIDPKDSPVKYYLGPKGNEGKLVTINGKKYMLVYADCDDFEKPIYVDKVDEKTGKVVQVCVGYEQIPGYKRTAANLHHIFEVFTEKDGDGKVKSPIKHMLTVTGITGYKPLAENYENDLKQRVVLEAFQYPCCRTLNEWDALEYGLAFWTYPANPTFFPKYWFDVLGNRYPMEPGPSNENEVYAKFEDFQEYPKPPESQVDERQVHYYDSIRNNQDWKSAFDEWLTNVNKKKKEILGEWVGYLED